ncbi:hypothetical protein MASR2M41_13760 [Flammeovirgaceae bacterium]
MMHMFVRNTLPFFLFVIIFSTCDSPREVSKEELIAYTLDEDNGLIQTINAGQYQLDLVYHPTDLMVLQELGESIPDTSRINQLRTKYSGHHYFLLQISKNGSEILNLENGQDEYSQLLQTLAFHMPQYVTTVQGSDTTSLSDFMLDRTYGMANSTNLLLVFESNEEPVNEEILIQISEFGLGIGSVQFRFNADDLEKAPKVKFPIY